MPTVAPIILRLFPAWKVERSPDVLELRPIQNPSTNAPSNLEGISRDEDTSPSLGSVLNGYRERCDAQDRWMELLPSKASIPVPFHPLFSTYEDFIDRLGQRLIELASFALLAYRGNPTQVFSNLYEIIDGMFARIYEATIRVHGEERDAALESLESLVTRMETLQSFLRRTEAASRRFVGDERDRVQNERFLISNIPPQVTLPQFHVTLERTRLPYPETRKTPTQPSFTPPNTPTGPVGRGTKRFREDSLEDGEIPSKRRC
ncbi:hypothetical protein K435DRAFT_856239 [Dendrothele bispora CBS 962.96]|uniref:Uncharacterized protein n=1 Tax=Dendrothele bispora (strain CBS 962.96) TaxID=1314807 RepID=A0A4S8MA68_DENBC|nr:hypothetical protein K435DRAFT_856239 [Dendrothele bispora CBS 962.96]